MRDGRIAGYPGGLDPEQFHPRPAERGLLQGLVRSLRRGWGRSVALCGAPGSGKTALLKAWWEELFREGAVLPFYHAFAAGSDDPAAEAAALIEGFAAQALAFRRRDPALLAAAAGPEVIREELASAWPEGASVVLAARRAGEGRAAMHAASLLPHRFAAATGTRVLGLYDDFTRLAPRDRGPLPGWAAEAVASRIAPAVLGCDDDLPLPRVLGAGPAAALETVLLAPLADGAARALLQQYLRAEGGELGSGALDAVVELAAGSPAALLEIAREAARIPAADGIAVARAYAAAVCRGGTARRARLRLAEALPDRSARATALEVLAFCLRDESAADAGRIAGRMFKNEREVAEAIAGLERGGFLRVDCSLVRTAPDPVLRDGVRALYRTEMAGVDAGVVEAELAAATVRSTRERERAREREGLRRALASILLAWDGQQVPAELLAAAGGEREGDLVTLPRVVAVTCGRVGERSSPAALDADALAFAWRGAPADSAAEVAWIARFLPGGPGTARQIEEFERAVSALQAAGGLPAARLVHWAILGAPPDPEGAREAVRRRTSVSTLEGLGALAALLGVPAAIARPAPAPAPRPEIELEMTIPAAAEAESVAARALDQLGENLAIPADERDRIRTALVEACINAFEHSGIPGGGRVRISFAVAGGDLRIRVENRGRPLPALPADPGDDGAPRRRGWGLQLIRRLVDEVELEPREDGVSLVMVKHLDGRGEGRG